jgi:hypothetical protein
MQELQRLPLDECRDKIRAYKKPLPVQKAAELSGNLGGFQIRGFFVVFCFCFSLISKLFF